MQDLPVAFVHRSVLADEAPRAVVCRDWSEPVVYVDATFGRGGHSRSILSLMGPDDRLYAFDRDPEAVAAARSIDDARFTIIHAPFSHMREELTARGVTRVAGILMDIGVSSPQIDDASRGFSFRADGPLDMRMDTTSGITAAEWLAEAPVAEIERVLRVYGEEKFAGRIARAIAERRRTAPLTRTAELADLVAANVVKNKRDALQNPATRTFQAVRIFINGELSELESALAQGESLLSPGGTLAVISFHSLEDRIVKHFFDAGAHPEKRVDARIALRAADMPAPVWSEVRRIKPSDAECEANPRARSAVMRTGVRTSAKGETP